MAKPFVFNKPFGPRNGWNLDARCGRRRAQSRVVEAGPVGQRALSTTSPPRRDDAARAAREGVSARCNRRRRAREFTITPRTTAPAREVERAAGSSTSWENRRCPLEMPLSSIACGCASRTG